mgnify:CR=1 FL=1
MAFLRPGDPVRSWLSGAAFLYGAAVRARMRAYDRGWKKPSRLPCRVVSVGNMTVGGTGKTPVVILLTEWLQAQGQRVAVISRGYKRTSTAAQVLVSDGTRVLAGPAEAGAVASLGFGFADCTWQDDDPPAPSPTPTPTPSAGPGGGGGGGGAPSADPTPAPPPDLGTTLRCGPLQARFTIGGTDGAFSVTRM